MPYRTEVPVPVLLQRQWAVPGTVVVKVCEYLPAVGRCSYINTMWAFRANCAEVVQLDSEYILQTGFWLRYMGSLWDDPGTFFDMQSPYDALLKNGLIGKAVRLAVAVMAVGYNPQRTDDANAIDTNLELLRLLCQGPWPRPAPSSHHYLAFQLAYCFRLLAVEAREGRDANAIRDLLMMEAVFANAYEVLGLGTWHFEEFRSSDQGLTGGPRLGDLFRPVPNP
jgi:hypothetical protein